MYNNFILEKILDVYKECEIFSFPFDCFSLLKNYNLRVFPYSSLEEPLYSYCVMFSTDALYFKGRICFNDNVPAGRIYFSLMHELGHYLLNHSFNRTSRMEQEANFFASNILAPRMAVHYAKCTNASDVKRVFHITSECAGYVWKDYERWLENIIHSKMNQLDKRMYEHFYNKHLDKFIYRQTECVWCQRLIYNSSSTVCSVCQSKHKNSKDLFSISEDRLLDQLDDHWHYGNL